jgi:hypothetical protein
MKQLLLSLIFFAFHQITFGQVVINEYSCSNITGPSDAYGEKEDWVELYNVTAAPIDLTGWYLSDKANNLIMKFFSSWNLINFAIMKI